MFDIPRTKYFFIFAILLILTLPVAHALDVVPLVDCYEPIPGGFHLRISADPNAKRLTPGERIGVVAANDAYSADPRLHRRPLFPPADRTLVFSPEELAKLERNGFRPLVVAYAGPRFLFDLHSAGGLLGHLYLGLIAPDRVTSKWFHQWDEVDVSYINGHMDYVLTDAAFPGVTVTLQAAPMADAAGLVIRIGVTGHADGTSLVWAYGGASAYFTNWAMNAAEFNFSPAQCAKDAYTREGNAFTLTRALDKNDVVMNEVFTVARKLPDWKAVIRGGSSWQAPIGFASPESFMEAPADLARTADTTGVQSKTGCVSIQEITLERNDARGVIAVGMGFNMPAALANTDRAWVAAIARCDAIGNRIVTHTPDPYLDAAVPMMAFATEGTWGDIAVLHGAWSWRFAYLGWRHWYGTQCFGWSDRIKTSIQNFVQLDRVASGPDEGALGSMLEYDPGVFYNMNEVFFDQVRQYFEYTNDIELMREIFPVLNGILQWEDRRLRPTDLPLYENALNTWISDQHWYIRGQCTQASAYMFGANRFMADLAARLGHSPEPYASKAEAIRVAMQQTLWMKRAGVFAEYLDTRGNKQLHPQPELPTLYHSAEFGATDMFQTYQMLDWADHSLRVEHTPGGGKLFWSSNWFPNMNRSYTHSTLELAYAENLNFALTHYLAGRADDAYAIQRACLAGIFNGVTPGALECHAYVDGRGRANDDFADAISMWGRTLVEGMFGIVPMLPDGVINLTPQFPSDWRDASIETPHFSYHWKQEPGAVAIDWNAPVEISVHLKMQVHAAAITEVRANGKPIGFRVMPGVGFTWVEVDTPSTLRGTIDVAYTPATPHAVAAIDVVHGAPVRIALPASASVGMVDPQSLLTDPKIANGTLEGTVNGAAGPGLLFAHAGTRDAPYFLPVRLNIAPETPAPAPRIWSAPNVPDRDLSVWQPIDIGAVYNGALPEVMRRVWEATPMPPAPASEVNTNYYKDHLVEPFVSPKPSDEAWRNKIGADGIGWTTDGIPFRSPKTGPNIGVVTLAGAFPAALEVPIGAQGKSLYLMISGTTFAMQSHVVNLRVTLRYADGSEQIHDLVNPFDIGDCWNQYRYHDTAANGFENLGGRSGPAGSREVKDMTKPVPVDTEAHLVGIELKPGVQLDAVTLEAIANDVIFGIMGATVLK